MYPENDMLIFLKIIKETRVDKIVFVSLLGVENPIVAHLQIENMIKELEIPYVFSRPSFFMQNLITNHKEEIKEKDELYISAGRSKISFVNTRNITKVSTIILKEDKYKNIAITLIGNDSIDYDELFKI